MAHEILVTLTRGSLEESHHHGAYCVWSGGRALRHRGDVDVAVYARSAIKPVQALEVVASGAPERFGLDDAELALVCASHDGSPRHAEAARSILAKAGEGPELLRCGGHRPLGAAVADEYVRRGYTPGRLEDNCSGKHAGMIAAAKARGAPPATYAEPDHPVQRANLAHVAALSGLPAASIPIGVDGCAVPTFALPVAALAQVMGRFATPDDLPGEHAPAARRLADVMTAHPEMVAGDGSFDTELMRAGRGRLLAKSGAEGVQLVGVRDASLGIAVKIDDGAGRARRAVVCALLIDLGLVAARDLEGLYPSEVRTREGATVGEVKVRL